MSYGPSSPDPMNPYQSSLPGGAGMGGPGNPMALAKVKGPATALLVTAVVGIILQVLGLIYSLVAGNAQPQLPPGADPQQVQLMQNIAVFSGTVGMVLGVISIVIGVVIILGALKMMKLERYGLAMTSAVLALIPCISPCCLLGLPFGIWAIIALNDATVKASFR
jgi:hypothetical protein